MEPFRQKKVLLWHREAPLFLTQSPNSPIYTIQILDE